MRAVMLRSISTLVITVVLAHRVYADTAEPSESDGDGVTTPAPPSSARGIYGSFGAGWLPSGVDGPGAANLEMFEGGAAFRLGRADLRVGAILALESTYYQSSVSGLAIGRLERYVGSSFSFGGGFGLGAGSFSPTNGYNAADGASAELVAIVVPARFHLGEEHRLELSLQVGTIYLTSFNETDFFYQVAIGYVRW